MYYQKLTLSFPACELSRITERLSLLGFSSFELEDYSDLCSDSARRFYDYIDDSLLTKQSQDPRIHFYFERTPKGMEESEQLLSLLKEPEFSCVKCTQELKDDSEWRDRWKEYFKPFCVGKHLFVYPPWEENVEIPKGREGILMDPSAAFGSGTHATTQLCLECAEAYLKPGDTVLDLGCGSGILALGAIKLGAMRADCVDIEESAVRVARANAQLNRIEESRFFVKRADVTRDILFGHTYDLVFANLVSSLLIALSKSFPAQLKPGGLLIASGILNVRKEETLMALVSCGLLPVECREREEWCTLVLRKDT